MMTRKEREKLDNCDDQSGFKLAKGGLAVLFPLEPGMDPDPLSFVMEPHVHCVGAIIGEAIELRLTTRGFNIKWELLRKPEGSKAQFATHTITLDKVGAYWVRVWLGAWRRDVAIGAWPLEQLNRLGRAPLPGRSDPHYFDRRQRLQGVCSDPRVTPQTLANALEGNPTFGFDGSIFGPGQPPVSTNW